MVEDERQLPGVTRRRLLGGGALAAVAAVGLLVADRDPDAGSGATSGQGGEPDDQLVDRTDELQSALDALPVGGTYAVPSGTVLRCTRTVELGVEGSRLTGPGELRFTDGIAAAPALRVTAPGALVQGLRVTNPRALFDRTGGDERNAGVWIQADGVTVDRCRVEQFGFGIAVAPDGEWLDTTISDNEVLGVLGAGGGRGSDTTDGEDRGDGITIWGARATVTGNVVRAGEGQDCRVGIHGEGLGDYEQRRVPDSNSRITISGNTVSGAFRRSIALEAIDLGEISGNTVEGATWWDLAVINGSSCTVRDNVVRRTRTADDDQGSAWSPIRSSLHVFSGRGHVVSGNSVTVTGVSDAHVSLVTLNGGRPTDIEVSDNVCAVDGGSCGTGVTMQGNLGPVAPVVRGNVLAGIDDAGVYLGEALDAVIADNTISAGAGGCEQGILAPTGTSDGAQLRGNAVTGAGTGVQLNGHSSTVVVGNLFTDCGTDILLYRGSVGELSDNTDGTGPADVQRG